MSVLDVEKVVGVVEVVDVVVIMFLVNVFKCLHVLCALRLLLVCPQACAGVPSGELYGLYSEA